MGKIIYGTMRQEIDLDDRAMAHLQAVVATKLRRGEGFFINWKDDPSVGDGRSSIWMSPSIPLYFRYSGSKPVTINREWLETLTLSANSTAGLQFTGEPNAVTSAPKSQV